MYFSLSINIIKSIVIHAETQYDLSSLCVYFIILERTAPHNNFFHMIKIRYNVPVYNNTRILLGRR